MPAGGETGDKSQVRANGFSLLFIFSWVERALTDNKLEYE